MTPQRRNLFKYLVECYRRGATVAQLIYYFTTDAETVWATLEWYNVTLRTDRRERIREYHNIVAYICQEKKRYGHLAEECSFAPIRTRNFFMLSIWEE